MTNIIKSVFIDTKKIIMIKKEQKLCHEFTNLKQINKFNSLYFVHSWQCFYLIFVNFAQTY